MMEEYLGLEALRGTRDTEQGRTLQPVSGHSRLVAGGYSDYGMVEGLGLKGPSRRSCR